MTEVFCLGFVNYEMDEVDFVSFAQENTTSSAVGCSLILFGLVPIQSYALLIFSMIFQGIRAVTGPPGCLLIVKVLVLLFIVATRECIGVYCIVNY